MHVHPNYSQQLSTLGVVRDEVKEMTARRAADVRRRLASAASLEFDDDAVAFVSSSERHDPTDEGESGRQADSRQPGDASDFQDSDREEGWESTRGQRTEAPGSDDATEREHGSLFSVLA